MIILEKLANTFICPIRRPVATPASINPEIESSSVSKSFTPPDALCCGKRCMAWEWMKVKTDQNATPSFFNKGTGQPLPEFVDSGEYGYCGMVRKF